MDAVPTKTWLKPILKPLRPAFREVIVISLFVNLLALALPVFILQVYDRVVFYQGISTLFGLVTGVLIAIAFDFVLRQARSRVLQRAAVRIDARLGESVFDKLMSLPLQILETRASNHWHVLFRDVDTVRNVYSGSTAVLAVDLPFVAIYLIIIFIIAAPIAWVILVAIPCFVFLALRSGKVMEGATGAEREAGISRDALIAELLAGRATIKALALAKTFKPNWEDKHVGTIDRAMTRGSKGDGYTNLAPGFSVLTTVALTTFGALAIVDQQITIGALIATNMLGNRMIGPFNQLVGAWRFFAQYKQSVARLGQLFGLESERLVSEIKLDRPKGELALEDLTYGYDPNRPPVINGVRLTIKPGGVVGIVGPNGCGKTTLLKIMQGLYKPSEGRVLLDGADITQFTREEIAGWIGYVPQECVLFRGTIRENIALADPDCSDEQLVRASTLAGVHGYVVDLPDGYATDVGEGGLRLSGGERQRIAIARSLVRDPPVLLFDEVGSNLDQRALAALREALLQLAPTHTIVLVSHVPVLLTACQHVVVIDHGKIRFAGPSRDVVPRLFAGAKPNQPAATPASSDGGGDPGKTNDSEPSGAAEQVKEKA